MPLRELIIDLDCYFASVEQQLHSAWRGKPIAIIPVNTRATSCIAASKEAKRFGVKTGTSVSDAVRLCPEIQFVESTPGAYIEIHNEFVEAVRACIQVYEEDVLSIDEVCCHLRPDQQSRAAVEKLVREIKSTISRRIGDFVTCSVGAAPNRFLAKLASDMGKPNGLFIIEKEDLPHCLDRLKLRDLCGIGKNMEQRLAADGIVSVAQLTRASLASLHHAWGSIQGTHMWHWLRGEVTELPPTKKSVLGHSHVLPPELRSEQGAHAVCHRLLQKAAMRLRKNHLFTSTLQVFIKFDDGRHWVDEATFTETQDTLEFLQVFEVIWKRHPKRRFSAPVATGVTFLRLTPAANVTPSLFDVAKPSHKLSSAMDQINRMFGKNKIVFGGAMEALDYTPMRIAFTRIPDPETEG